MATATATITDAAELNIHPLFRNRQGEPLSESDADLYDGPQPPAYSLTPVHDPCPSFEDVVIPRKSSRRRLRHRRSTSTSASTSNNNNNGTASGNRTLAAGAADADANAPPRQPSTAFNKKFHSVTSKAGWPLNKAANVLGAEGWWPMTMDRECAKAARILYSFTRPAAQLLIPEPSQQNAPKHPTGRTKKSLVKIPDVVLQTCAGIAIFNMARASACHASLSAGSGLVVARRPDGSWSPPSAFVVSTLGAGPAAGLNVSDCICVLHTPAQVSAFANPRVSLGGTASIAVGPVGTGGRVDAALARKSRPVWSYIKSRGLWVGAQIDGTIMVSRADANSVFYDERSISARRILYGDVAWPEKGKPLLDMLAALDGRLVGSEDVAAVEGVGECSTLPPSGVTPAPSPPPSPAQSPSTCSPSPWPAPLFSPTPGASPATPPQRQQQPPPSSSSVESISHRSDESILDEKERLARSGF